MAQVEFALKKGLDVGGLTHTNCVLREPTAGDVIDASEESEKVVLVGLEPQLVTSPTLVGINTLRRQIVRIGEVNGPLEREMFGKLSPEDLNLIQQQAEQLEQAARKVSQRGRTDGAGGRDTDRH